MSEIDFKCSNLNVTGVTLNKIKIDWGDGNVDVISKSIAKSGGGITTKELSWKIAKHLYNTDKRNVYLTDNIDFLPKITIYLYNTYNDIVRIVIPFKLIYKTIYDMNCQFDILSSNITNNNRVSYVIKEQRGDSVAVVQSTDWALKNQDDIVYITDNIISEDYSNEFINEDAIIWDWDAVPYINITVEYIKAEDETITGFLCQYVEETVAVESSTIHVNLLLDSGNQTIKVDDPVNGVYTIPATHNGIYEIYFELKGINDVSGESKKIYKPKDITYNPYASIHADVYKNEGTNINVTYTKSDDCQWKYIKDAKLILKPNWIDCSSDKLTEYDEEDRSADFKKADDSYEFEFKLNTTPLSGQSNTLSTSIPLKSLPNGEYDAKYHFEDVLGYVSESTMNIEWNYTKICDEMSVTIDDNKLSNTQDFSITVKNPSELDKISLNVKENETKKILLNKRLKYDDWNYVHKDGEYKFIHQISNSIIPDGNYTVTASHIVEMTSFVGERKKSISETMSFEYPIPDCSVGKSYPCFSYSVGQKRWIPFIRIENVNFTKDSGNVISSISDLKLKSVTNDKEKEINLEAKNVFDIQFKDIGYSNIDDTNMNSDISFVYRDFEDSRIKRYKTHDLISLKRNGVAFDKMICEIPDRKENVSASDTFEDENGTVMTGNEVMNESAIDVYKSHKFVDGTTNLYASKSTPNSYYSVNDNNIYTYFKVKKYTNTKTNEVHHRFVWSDVDKLIGSSTALSTGKAQLSGKVTHSESYNQSNNTQTFKININSSEITKDSIIQADLNVYKSTDSVKPVYTTTLKNDAKSITI